MAARAEDIVRVAAECDFATINLFRVYNNDYNIIIFPRNERARELFKRKMLGPWNMDIVKIDDTTIYGYLVKCHSARMAWEFNDSDSVALRNAFAFRKGILGNFITTYCGIDAETYPTDQSIHPYYDPFTKTLYNHDMYEQEVIRFLYMLVLSRKNGLDEIKKLYGQDPVQLMTYEQAKAVWYGRKPNEKLPPYIVVPGWSSPHKAEAPFWRCTAC